MAQMDRNTAKDLESKAHELWEARGRVRDVLPDKETFLGEFPTSAGQVMVINRKTMGRRSPIYRFRFWAVAPSGERIPMSWGMSVTADALPHLAAFIAKAVEMELDNHTDQRRPVDWVAGRGPGHAIDDTTRPKSTER